VGGLAPLRFPLVARRGQPTTGVKRGHGAGIALMLLFLCPLTAHL